MPAAPDVGPDAPAAAPALGRALHAIFGHAAFRPGQEAILTALLAGRDTLGVLPTGGGKSVCYQLPAMLLPRSTVVVSPLIALMQDQLESLPAAVRRRATVLNSQLEAGESERRLAAVARGEARLVYVAPERLRQRPLAHALAAAGVSLLVVDEAHCIALWGHDFRPDYLAIPRALDELAAGGASATVLALTATATPAIRAEVGRRLGRQFLVVDRGTLRPNLSLEVVACPNRAEKWVRLRELCREEPGAILVYVDRRALAEALADRLRESGIAAAHYHAGMEREEREAAQRAFMDGATRVMVATIAFGMGIDKPDVRMVAHFTPPPSLEVYHQEAGRAGRDGLPARCVLLGTPTDRDLLAHRARAGAISTREVGRVYEAVRERLSGGEAVVQADDLERELELDDTTLRVALGLLEAAGVVARGEDLPQVVTLWWSGATGSAEFAAFAAAARLRPRQRIALETAALAAATAIPLAGVERRLLDWQSRGWLETRGSARGFGLEVVGDLDEASLHDLLRETARNDAARLAALDDFMETRRCRAQALATYLGGALPPPCGRCDNCRARHPLVRSLFPAARATPPAASDAAGGTPDAPETGVLAGAWEQLRRFWHGEE